MERLHNIYGATWTYLEDIAIATAGITSVHGIWHASLSDGIKASAEGADRKTVESEAQWVQCCRVYCKGLV